MMADNKGIYCPMYGLQEYKGINTGRFISGLCV